MTRGTSEGCTTATAGSEEGEVGAICGGGGGGKGRDVDGRVFREVVVVLGWWVGGANRGGRLDS